MNKTLNFAEVAIQTYDWESGQFEDVLYCIDEPQAIRDAVKKIEREKPGEQLYTRYHDSTIIEAANGTEDQTVTIAKNQGRFAGKYTRNSDPSQVVSVLTPSMNVLCWPFGQYGIVPDNPDYPIRKMDSIIEIEKLYTKIS